MDVASYPQQPTLGLLYRAGLTVMGRNGGPGGEGPGKRPQVGEKEVEHFFSRFGKELAYTSHCHLEAVR